MSRLRILHQKRLLPVSIRVCENSGIPFCANRNFANTSHIRLNFSVLASFFPIVVNVATGLATIEPEMEDVLRALGAKKLDIMTKVGIPRSLPYFFGSLKVAITLAFIGSVLFETIAANKGLGHMMLTAQANFEVPLVFACLIALAIEGIGMYAIMAWLEMRMTGWAHRSGFAR